MLIEDGRIAAIEETIVPPPEARVIDGSMHLVTPGFVNAHLHSFAALQKGKYDNLPLELWMLYAYPSKGVAPLSERMIYLRTLVVGMESLRAGVTSVLDDVLECPSQDLNALRTVFRAYRDLGLRASCSGYVLDRHLIDSLPYMETVVPPSVLAELRQGEMTTVDDYIAFSKDALVEAATDRDGLVRYVLSPSGPQRCTPELLAATHDLAVASDSVFHLHVLETKGQLITSAKDYDRSLIQYMSDLGVLSDHTTMAHCIWLTERDIELIAEAGATVVHNPTSNLRTGAGIAPWASLRERGVNLALGTDGIASNGSARLFDVMRTAALIHKVVADDPARWPRAEDILQAATRGGATATRRESEVGALEVGMAADLVLFRLDSYNFTPLNDLSNHLVYSENGASVDTVIVGGRVVLDERRITGVDERAILAEFRELMPEFTRMWEHAEAASAAYHQYFADLYRRAADQEMSMERRLSMSDLAPTSTRERAAPAAGGVPGDNDGH
ncbi:MAG: amidohydrolase family protein [Actinomycetota bacterium]